ncbi:hypothetical protein HJD18_03470 [Thermoleophilia bacterium SCSIO 60948]|nr:hypothetical protein HJD18_03470 [Thermoleophilia bacterium SCSIO 60948]
MNELERLRRFRRSEEPKSGVVEARGRLEAEIRQPGSARLRRRRRFGSFAIAAGILVAVSGGYAIASSISGSADDREALPVVSDPLDPSTANSLTRDCETRELEESPLCAFVEVRDRLAERAGSIEELRRRDLKPAREAAIEAEFPDLRELNKPNYIAGRADSPALIEDCERLLFNPPTGNDPEVDRIDTCRIVVAKSKGNLEPGAYSDAELERALKASEDD